MNFEDFQKAWKSQDTGATVTIDTDMLLKEVRRNQQQFRATIFWRDVREVGVAVLLTLYFSYHGVRHHNWTFYLLAIACFGVGTFMVVDRLIQRKKQPATNDSLKGCIETSLNQVNHQIWLLKNVLWWYLLPIAVPLGISVSTSLWHSPHVVSDMIRWGVYIVFVILLYWGIYWLNQFAVRKSLEPRRQELETLLASLE